MLPLWLWWCMDHDHGNFAFDLFNDQLDDGKSERIWLDHDLFSLPLLLLLAKSRWEKMIERGSKNGSSFANQTIISPWKAIGLGTKKNWQKKYTQLRSWEVEIQMVFTYWLKKKHTVECDKKLWKESANQQVHMKKWFRVAKFEYQEKNWIFHCVHLRYLPPHKTEKLAFCSVKLSHVSRRPSSSLKSQVTRHDNAPG